VTEEQLASLFQDCGQVVDCRVCGDANSAMRFAFIEFFEPEAVTNVCPLEFSILNVMEPKLSSSHVINMKCNS
jgi:hypothetical protein